MTTVFETERLLLKTWEPKHEEPYFRINQNPRFMNI